MSELLFRLPVIDRTLRWWLASIFLHVVVVAWCAPTFFFLNDQRQAPVDQVLLSKGAPFVVQLVSSGEHSRTNDVRQNRSADDVPHFSARPASAVNATASFALPIAMRLAEKKPQLISDNANTAVTFHLSDELTKKPELIGGAPDLIDISVANASAGYVIFRLSIDRHGIVKSIRTLRSSLLREVEAELVVPLYRAQYSPGEIDGIPVDGEIDMLFEVHPS